MITEQRLERLAELTLANAIRLHHDSVTLFTQAAFASSRFLSIHALEELGKALLVGDCLYFMRTDSLSEKELEQALDEFYNHRSKQFRLRVEDRPWKRRLLEHARSGELEREKQNSIYVGLVRDRGKIDLGKPVRNPSRTTRNQAEGQISEVADFLIELTCGVLLGTYLLDSSRAESLLDRSLLRSLVHAWPPSRQTTRRTLALVESSIPANGDAL